MRVSKPAVIVASALLFLQAAAAVATINYDDVPAGLKRYIPVQGAGFAAYVAGINRETTERVREGDEEALVYFVLQSSAFTREPPIGPALSAREFHDMNGVIPSAVLRRFADFLRALHTVSGDSRLGYFDGHLTTGQRTSKYLSEAYARAMKFLHEKETGTRWGVYESRGYSTDTRLAASFTVRSALSVLQAMSPRLSISKVLMVEPGIDFVPRTDFDDRDEPQSYQPYAVADALLSLGLARSASLGIDCVDVNGQVLAALPARKMHLRIEPGTAEFMRYEQQLQSGMARALAVGVSAKRLNIITERLPGSKYDLIIATNVLLYFPAAQLALALANIDAMLVTGGYFIHNELRPETELYTKELGLQWLQGRRILIAQGWKMPLYDTFSILRK